MSEQLGLGLPSRTARGRDDFLVAPSNALAAQLVDSWPDWPLGKLLLCGPEGAGKTHLVHVWAQLSGARIIEATDLIDADIPSLAAQPVAVEDVDQIATQPMAQDALFHLHNLSRAENQSLLMTGTGPLESWGLTLPDLKSRLQGTTTALLEAPDDDLLAVIMVKLLTDRQLKVGPTLIPYLVTRMERSFAAANRLIEALDHASLAKQRPITRQLAAEVLDKLTHEAR